MDHRLYGQSEVVSKLVITFVLAFAVATLGLAAGSFVPSFLMLPLMILELLLIIVLVFTKRSKKFGYGLMYSFMLVSGMTLFPVLSHYVSTIGAGDVLKAFLIASISFVVVAVYAVKTKVDYSFLGIFLLFALLILLAVLIGTLFIPFSSTLNLIIAIAGTMIFLGFTLYDFNRLARKGVREEEIPLIVIDIYLDFVNLFLSILRFFRR
jgi:uncharacterized protein